MGNTCRDGSDWTSRDWAFVREVGPARRKGAGILGTAPEQLEVVVVAASFIKTGDNGGRAGLRGGKWVLQRWLY